MTSIYAPTTRARRVFIALLAFALAVALAIVATAAPADAARDKKEYTAEVGPPPDNEVTVSGGAGSSATVTFTNVSSTTTQLAGSFSVAFPSEFTVTGTTIISSSDQSWTPDSPILNNTVIVTADGGGERIGVSDDVVVKVFFDAPASGTFELTTEADQQSAGVFGGGNRFKLVGSGEPTLIVVTCPLLACQTVEGEGFEALVACADPECIAFDPFGDPLGFQYELTVQQDGDTQIIVVLTTTDGLAPPPGQLEIEVELKDESKEFIDECGKSGGPPQENCYHVNRISGKNLEITIIWDKDPRFRFR